MDKQVAVDLQNIVWFKKDLRVLDHQALFQSLEEGPTLGLFLLEDEWMSSPEFSLKHLQFAFDSLQELEKKLAALQVPLLILNMNAVDAFHFLKKSLNFKKIFSHQETGVWWTYQRDLKLKNWCKEHQVTWQESLQFSVLRKLKNRDTWNQKRIKIINRSISSMLINQNTESVYYKLKQFINTEAVHLRAVKIASESNTSLTLTTERLNLKNLNIDFKRNSALQVGGSDQAHLELKSFLASRVFNYQKGISSPVTAITDCSRLSPYITWGTISLSQIHDELQAQKSKLDLTHPKTKVWLRNVKSFESRLWWHCHFIQKLESEPTIEFKNMNAGFDGMRENDFNTSYFEAWQKGETGFPFIDACMRCLIQTGWINFRMRALLVSFASYQLWLHWKQPATHLAQLFTDFEPGIHFSQMQMQSGVTGINTIRMYSALKQSMDQDPKGEFIKRFCPELEPVDVEYIHEPHLMPPMIQIMCGVKIGETYPEPIVDHKKAFNQAKEKIYQWRSSKAVKDLARQVYQKHGSRKNSFFPAQHRKPFGNFSNTLKT